MLDATTFAARTDAVLQRLHVCRHGLHNSSVLQFPGLISPSLGLQFSVIRNRLAALSKVPGLGWALIIFFAGVIEGKFESKPGFQDYTAAVPGEHGWNSSLPLIRRKCDVACLRIHVGSCMMLDEQRLCGAWKKVCTGPDTNDTLFTCCPMLET